MVPLFTCSQCGCVENTALCRYWTQPKGPKLCSACYPPIGKWHGKFPREKVDDDGRFHPEDEDNPESKCCKTRRTVWLKPPLGLTRIVQAAFSGEDICDECDEWLKGEPMEEDIGGTRHRVVDTLRDESKETKKQRIQSEQFRTMQREKANIRWKTKRNLQEVRCEKCNLLLGETADTVEAQRLYSRHYIICGEKK